MFKTFQAIIKRNNKFSGTKRLKIFKSQCKQAAAEFVPQICKWETSNMKAWWQKFKLVSMSQPFLLYLCNKAVKLGTNKKSFAFELKRKDTNKCLSKWTQLHGVASWKRCNYRPCADDKLFLPACQGFPSRHSSAPVVRELLPHNSKWLQWR